MKTIYLLFISFLLFGNTYGQNKQSCKVINSELTGTYIGDCQKGRADGKGEFTFADGSYVYVGHFEDGKMHGNGEIFSIDKKKRTSIRKGTWEDNVYVGDDSEPYVVKRTVNLDRHTVLKKPADDNTVMINFFQNGNRNNNVTDLNVVVNNGNRMSGNFTEGYENIIFPFICQVNYRTQNKFKTTTYNVMFEIVINEPGSWEIFLYN